MPKQIKFNLIIDKKPIRDVDDLLENFNIEDLLETYQNGSLKRWLLVRDLTKEANELDKVKGDAVETALELCRIFHADCIEEQLKQVAYHFDVRQKYFEKLNQMASLKNQRDEMIRSYHSGYDKLLSDMEVHCEDYPFIKTAIMQINREYLGLFILDIQKFYDHFIFDYPLVIIAVMANLEMCTLLTQIMSKDTIFKHISDPKYVTESFVNRYKNNIAIPFTKRCEKKEDLDELKEKTENVFVLKIETNSESYSSGGSAIKSFKTANLKTPFLYIEKDISILPRHVQSFSRATDNYWLDVIPCEKKCMIISMKEGNFIRNAGKNGEKISAKDVNGNFLYFDGIDYMSKNDTDKLVFMEV
jgi:hypothetical protein